MLLLLVGTPACGSCDDSSQKGDEGRRKPLDDDATPLEPPEVGKLVYLVSKDHKLYSFDPRRPGMSAYDLIGPMDCERGHNPQSMAVDRNGSAWVFYDSRRLYRVSLADASCKPTSYVHPTHHFILGMGFTATEPGGAAEQLFIMSPAFGLATVDMPSLAVRTSGSLAMSAELTGGADARLFAFEGPRGVLYEVDRRTRDARHLYTLRGVGEVDAWAFGRYAGRFYFFTADIPNDSRCIEVDLERKTQRVRDEDLGFIVVGAGQSTLVPPRDTNESLKGEWKEPEEERP